MACSREDQPADIHTKMLLKVSLRSNKELHKIKSISTERIKHSWALGGCAWVILTHVPLPCFNCCLFSIVLFQIVCCLFANKPHISSFVFTWHFAPFWLKSHLHIVPFKRVNLYLNKVARTPVVSSKSSKPPSSQHTPAPSKQSKANRRRVTTLRHTQSNTKQSAVESPHSGKFNAHVSSLHITPLWSGIVASSTILLLPSRRFKNLHYKFMQR